MRECGIGIADIMCDGLTCENVHRASMAAIDDMICDDLTYDDRNPDMCENVVLGLLIKCLMM